MNTARCIAIVAALLITTAGMVGIANHGNVAAAATQAGTASAEVRAVQILPAIHVTPTPEQLRELNAR